MSKSENKGLDLVALVEALARHYRGTSENGLKIEGHRLAPDREVVIALVEDLKKLLFPGYYGATDITPETMPFHMGAVLDRVRKLLPEQINRAYCFTCANHNLKRRQACIEKAEDTAVGFLGRLPIIQATLLLDIRAAFEGDPAATSPDEALVCYPGVQSVTCHRLAHELHLMGVPLLPRIISEYSHSVTGIDIHPGASIGERFFIDHGTGVVIGETSIIGKNVRLYQGVTLGAKSFPLDKDGKPVKGIPRHPMVEDDVTIYAGATVLGRVTVGKGSTVGSNVWLTTDVPPGTKVSQAVADKLANKGEFTSTTK
jgi:serine O-acetyltransferase